MKDMSEAPGAEGVRAAIGILRQRMGDRLDTGAAMRAQHGHTTTWIETEAPDAVAFPESEAEVAEIVRTCAAHRCPVIPFGAGTSLEGHVNAPAGGVCVDLSRMDAVLAVRPEDMDCTVQPGVTRVRLNEELRATGLFFPVDPGADASLGGMVATGASGTNAVRYGTIREQVLGLRVVLPSGAAIRTSGRARKSSAGYDLTRLMIGSEGTLGIVTEITLRLHGIPEAVTGASCSFPTVAGAAAAVTEVIQCGVPVARIELLDALQVRAVNAYSRLSLPEAPLLLMEFHGTEGAVAEQAETVREITAGHGGTDYAVARDADGRARLWQARHDAYWAALALRPGAKGISTDTCVPLGRLAEAVGAAADRAAADGLVAPIVGHAGDGNFHVLLLVDMADPAEVSRARAYVGWLNDLAIGMDGTCTGEHGIGQGKAAYLRREHGGAVDAMGAIKAALDPLGIMNPGKLGLGG